MIVPDINLLVYTYNADATQHPDALRWWEDVVNGDSEVGIPWAVATGYVRIMSSPQVLTNPIDPISAIADVRSWLAVPNVNVVEPGPRHLDILTTLLQAAGVAGALTTDAHLAAIAIEHSAELHSNDADFSRFPGLRWFNPLTPRR